MRRRYPGQAILEFRLPEWVEFALMAVPAGASLLIFFAILWTEEGPWICFASLLGLLALFGFFLWLKIRCLVPRQFGSRIFPQTIIKQATRVRTISVSKDAMSAEEFLSWSMDRYAAMSTFQARVEIENEGQGATRRIAYERPNRFRIESSPTSEFGMWSICDGTKHVEYSSQGDQEPIGYAVPDSIFTVSSMYMKHPMFCGSLLYQFFGGSQNFGQLVRPEKASVEYGDSQDINGESARTVTFYGCDMYGHVNALIGADSGLVYRLEYDSEPLYEMMSSPEHRAMMVRTMKSQLAKLGPGERRDHLEKFIADNGPDAPPTPPRWTTHVFRDFVIDSLIEPRTFDTTIPDGREVVEQGDRGKPPVPIGKPSPDFTVQAPDGSSVTLSDLRGQVVLIDLWATWCGPCRKGLPDTMVLAEEGARDGFRLMAISNEDLEVIEEFVQEEALTKLPVYADTSGEVWTKYKVSGIPTVIVVDAEGNLSAFMVGLHPIAALRSAVEKARMSS